jgi:cytochrome c-type biogenesis protein CcmH
MNTDTSHLQDLRQQLLQLDSLARSGALTPEQASQARARLERQLVDQVMAGATPAPDAGSAAAASPAPGPATAAPRARWRWPVLPRRAAALWVGVVVFVAVVAAGGYLTLGGAHLNDDDFSGDSTGTPVAGADGKAPHSMDESQIEGMVSSLATRLAQQPDDIDGWLMLGRSYMVLGRHDDAIGALRRVIAKRPDDAQALADLADALATRGGRKLDGEAAQMVDRALRADPKNLKALSLAATRAWQAQDYAAAARYWDAVVAVGPATQDLVVQARANADDARAKLGQPPKGGAPGAAAVAPLTAALSGTPAGTSNATPARGTDLKPEPRPDAKADAARSVQGTVELAPALQARAKPDDTVFIFARPAEGSRMPLAILKRQVRDLPYAFALGDGDAMAGAKLSDARQVVVGARVSKGGQAMVAPGDLQGLSKPVAVGERGLRVVIDQIAP